ncbi:3-methyl-2-oxobutanoate hydroxymethyltransferase [Salinibacillus xinjiangensis]|uniref:3-methyl-2-oxobutanoate hydroxymethyltransferase n=1 Tax=Salinibacillus xinjiangensis TaxID=1229268 RepID=A0A6G1X6D5_9BACI|nr:3-methyl-2-oxobutanoate hydroxymethyltransferase [Salinibacillus xinjiangensis]MRG86378.1 3-methyl-2-oxobutanoate hydroxymethyltransferase [Salinibacillus xinjiangensis]
MISRVKLRKMKENKEKISMITAYDFPSAKLSQEAGVDIILVGDSLGNVVLGYDSTIPVTVDDMIHHGKAVKRGADDTFVVVDMPFMSFHVSKADTMQNAKRIFQQTDAQALKLEGAGEVIETIEYLTHAGIPVVGHLGLTPQTVNVLGGYRIQGKNKKDAEELIENAKKLEEAGAIAIVLECVPESLARLVTEYISIPTIGIGAGKHCDGQVLVYHDILQYGGDWLPKFVKPYGNMNELVKSSISHYVQEVKEVSFPTEDHSFHMDEDELPSLYGGKE